MASFLISDVLLWDILLRVPVKSLLRFRRVSKAWRDHIDSPVFVKLHMDQSEATHDLVLLRGEGVIGLIDCSAALLSDNPLWIYDQFCPRFSIHGKESYSCRVRRIESFNKFCSCNGLICFFNGYDVPWLWNPSTGRQRSIPRGKYRTKISRDNVAFRDYVFGLGHDVHSDDYLIIRILGLKGRNPSNVEIYSLNENCWTTLADIPYRIDVTYHFFRDNKCPALLNGVLHWVGESLSSEEHPQTIIGFDIASRNFREVLLPDILKYSSSEIDISILDGCLCVIRHSPDSHLTIWVMKEYGLRESWVELCNTREPLFLLGFSKNGELIVEKRVGTDLYLYDVKNQTFRNLRTKYFGCKLRWSGVSFFESLVPLDHPRKVRDTFDIGTGRSLNLLGRTSHQNCSCCSVPPDYHQR